MLTILTGGTGGAKLIQGLAAETNAAELSIICNTGDDCVLHGLAISPDIDTITYTLAGVADDVKGWGINDETFHVLQQLERLGAPVWFKLGDKDLATHLRRTALLRNGWPLSRVCDEIRRRLGVAAAILPMSDDRVETRVTTADGEISFQEYFVKGRWSQEVLSVRYAGIENSRPAPGVLEAIAQASAIVVCPSNPITSIGPMLEVPGIRAALAVKKRSVAAVSPIVGNGAVSGPAHKLMEACGLESSAFGVAQKYADFIGTLVIAAEDASMASRIEQLGVRAVPADIIMKDIGAKRRLAAELLALLRK